MTLGHTSSDSPVVLRLSGGSPSVTQTHYLRDNTDSNSGRYQLQVSELSLCFLASCVVWIKELCALLRAKPGADQLSIMNVTGLCVSALLMAHLTSTFPTGTNPGTITSTRPLLELQYLLDSLKSLTELSAEDVLVPQRAEEMYGRPSHRADKVPGSYKSEEEPADTDLPQDELDEALIHELLSAKNLKATRNNSNRNSSGCFGRRMDRIGSMSSLGCNTVGRNSAKSA
ncbi:brain natriuretic peptide-like [Eucyclogobius newberryi]|uniref:brain natriuretic peptide-like n=1 Tax=Eucyclogobius newberryi TaxID=166745 RepID=UPI003B5B44E4